MGARGSCSRVEDKTIGTYCVLPLFPRNFFYHLKIMLKIDDTVPSRFRSGLVRELVCLSVFLSVCLFVCLFVAFFFCLVRNQVNWRGFITER